MQDPRHDQQDPADRPAGDTPRDERRPYQTPVVTTLDGKLSLLLGTATGCTEPGVNLE